MVDETRDKSSSATDIRLSAYCQIKRSDTKLSYDRPKLFQVLGLRHGIRTVSAREVMPAKEKN